MHDTRHPEPPPRLALTGHRSLLTFTGITWRNLYRQPVRTLLTSVGVATGVIAVVAFGSVARGLYVSTNAAIHFADGVMMVFQAGAAADILSTLDEQETRRFLESDPDVVRVIPTLSHILPAEGIPLMLIIAMPDEDVAVHQQNLTSGRLIQAPNEVLLGSIAARVLKKDVGETLWIGRDSFNVVGLFHTDVVFFNGSISMDLRRLQQISQKEGKVTSFQVITRPGADAQQVVARLERNNPKIYAVASADQYKKVDQGLEMANSAVWAVSFLAIVVGCIIVTNTMWMSVHERTREIGVLRAVGWSRRSIIRMVILEAACVGAIACVFGCFAGVGLAQLSTHLPFMDRFVDPRFDQRPFLQAVAVAVVLSVVGGMIPAWRAARISPAEALRHE